MSPDVNALWIMPAFVIGLAGPRPPSTRDQPCSSRRTLVMAVTVKAVVNRSGTSHGHNLGPFERRIGHLLLQAVASDEMHDEVAAEAAS
jgi:hypothetical protein